MSTTYFVRTEPRGTSSNLEAGIAARIHDPAWMLGRQWQLGELLGEDAGSPISVTLDADMAMVSRYRRRGHKSFERYDPQTAPLETLVEAEAQRTAGAWTARLRIDTGRAFMRALHHARLDTYAPTFRGAFAIDAPTPAQQVSDPAGTRLMTIAAGRVLDGERLFEQFAGPLRDGTALPVIAGVAATDVDPIRDVAAAWLAWCDETMSEGGASTAWQPETIDYAFDIATGTGANATVLQAEGYRGGSLEWHAFNAVPTRRALGFTALPTQSVLPTGVQLRGMPNARWWEFEDATVDMGAVDAGASDVARLAFLEFALVYGNDFFAVPLRLPIGSLTRVTSLVVADTFGMRLSIGSANRRAGAQGASRFSLFALTEQHPPIDGIDPVSDLLFLAPVAHQILASAPVEDVLLLRDEMANLAWAVERRYEGGRGQPIERHEQAVLATPDRRPPHEDAALAYQLGTGVPPHWFPLVPELGAGDVRLALQRMTNRPAGVVPLGRLLDLDGPPIADADVPREGTRLLRDYAMTRWTDGSVFVWSRRRREIGRGEGSSGLRFDVADHEPHD